MNLKYITHALLHNSGHASQIKDISFPAEELDSVRRQDRIITTRCSNDYYKFSQGDIVRTPWGGLFRVEDRLDINDVQDHPFREYLTPDQRDVLKKYRRIAVLRLRKLSI